MSIFHFRELWNGHRAKILISAAAFLFGSASFLAGYLVAFEYRPTPIIIEKCSSTL